MTQFPWVFEINGSDRRVILVIRGQVLAQTSLKGHLSSYSAKFLVKRPFLVFWKYQNSSLIIYMDSTWSPLSNESIVFSTILQYPMKFYSINNIVSEFPYIRKFSQDFWPKFCFSALFKYFEKVETHFW